MDHFKQSEGFMTTWDQSQLYYRAWLPPGAAHKAVVLFHRGHEHSGRFHELVQKLDLKDCAFFAWDARGNGNSPGPRDYADDFAVYVKDANAFVSFVSEKYQIRVSDMVVLAHSVGGVIASTWVHDYAPPIRALVLVTPAFRIKLYVPFAIPLLRWAQKANLLAVVPSYVKAKVLTHDPEQRESYDRDPQITHSISTRILLDAHDTSRRIIADAGAIRVPTLLLGAGADWVVRLSAQKAFFEGLSSENKEMIVYPKFYHALLHEKERHLPIAKAREFITEVFKPRAAERSLLSGGKYTRREYDRLVTPLPFFTPRRLYFAAVKAVLQTLGRLSEGVRIGWQKGFDSGESLDYVYENKARGVTPVGRLLDRVYLDSAGWKGIRQRKANLEKVLRVAIERVKEEHRPVRLLDIASGPGRYVLDTFRRMPDIEMTAVLRDRDPLVVEKGRELAGEMKTRGVTYVQGDAFDPESLAGVNPAPTIAIVSGLYELFPDNQIVLQSLRGVGKALREGGYLIYTNQPWHPQLEIIARVLRGREGRSWVMRRRTQEEMDELVREASFEKLGTEIDSEGIFTVSVARTRAPAAGASRETLAA